MRFQSGIAEKVAGIPADRHTIKRASCTGLPLFLNGFFCQKNNAGGSKKLKIIANMLTLEKAYGGIT